MLHVVTTATHKKGYYNILNETVEQSGKRLVTLGLGEKWGGFLWKYKKVQEWLPGVPDDDIVVVVDAYDVIMIHPGLLEEKFKSYGKPIVFSRENDTYQKNAFFKYVTGRIFGSCVYNGEYMPINAGCFMGRAWALRKFLDYAREKYDFNDVKEDDQKIVNTFCAKSDKIFDELIGIDTESAIFATINRVGLNRGSDIDLGKFPLDDPGRCPNFAHGPGNSDLTALTEHLGIANAPKPRSEYSLNAVKTYAGYFVPEIVIVLLAIATVALFVYLRRRSAA